MIHEELVQKLKKLNRKNRDIEVQLGMPKNSLSGMLNDEKRMPQKWKSKLEALVFVHENPGTAFSFGKIKSKDGDVLLVPEIHPANFPGMTPKESGDAILKLLEEVPGLKVASEIPVPEKPLIFKAPNKEIFDSPRASSILMDEASMWASPKESEDELLGKAVRAAAKKLKQDPYELLAWVIENFGKKPEIKSHEKQTAQAGETYFQKRQREKNNIVK